MIYEPLIQKYATKWGIDPNIALRVAQSEGGTKGWVRSGYEKGGFREPSYGPFQMLVGGQGTGFPEGMGNQFIAKTGLDPRDPANAEPYMDFAMQQAATKGWSPWYGAAKAGISRWQGIGGNTGGGLPSLQAANSSVASDVAKALPTVGAVADPTVSLAGTLTGGLPSAAAKAAPTPNPMGGVFGLLLQSRMQQQPSIPEHTEETVPRPKMVDNRPKEEIMASISQTPNVYRERLRKRYG